MARFRKLSCCTSRDTCEVNRCARQQEQLETSSDTYLEASWSLCPWEHDAAIRDGYYTIGSQCWSSPKRQRCFSPLEASFDLALPCIPLLPFPFIWRTSDPQVGVIIGVQRNRQRMELFSVPFVRCLRRRRMHAGSCVPEFSIGSRLLDFRSSRVRVYLVIFSWVATQFQRTKRKIVLELD